MGKNTHTQVSLIPTSFLSLHIEVQEKNMYAGICTYIGVRQKKRHQHYNKSCISVRVFLSVYPLQLMGWASWYSSQNWDATLYA